MEIFQAARRPAARTTFGGIRWYTWSNEARALFARFRDDVDSLPVEVANLGPQTPGEYDLTYLVKLDGLDGEFRRNLFAAATALRHFTPDADLVLLTGMIDDSLSGRFVHTFLAALRSAVAELSMSPRAAIHSTPSLTGPEVGEFPLHCDLYPCNMVMLVFEQVAPDLSGASMLLPTRIFCELVTTTPEVPEPVRVQILKMLHEVSEKDRFDEFFALVYGSGRGLTRSGHSWTSVLREKMEARCYEMKFEAGEGYLLDDRRWLHGRRSPSNGVPRKRLHRLAFSSAPASGATGPTERPDA